MEGLSIKVFLRRAVVKHALNPCTWEAKTGGSLRVQGQPGLHTKNNNQKKPWFYYAVLAVLKRVMYRVQAGLELIELHLPLSVKHCHHTCPTL